MMIDQRYIRSEAFEFEDEDEENESGLGAFETATGDTMSSELKGAPGRRGNKPGSVPSSRSPVAQRSRGRILTYTAKDVIDARISVPAQHALVRQSKNPNFSATMVGLLDEIKVGRLAGIFCVNWQKPTQWARMYGSQWWTVIPPKVDAVLMLDPFDPFSAPPLIAFSRELDPDCGLLPGEKRFAVPSRRLDAALISAESVYRHWQAGRIVRCGSLPSRPVATPYVFPDGLCIAPAAPETRLDELVGSLEGDFEQSEVGQLAPSRSETPVGRTQKSGGTSDVRRIQESLNRILGLKLAVDGRLGPATRSAIRSFQQKQGLTADGIVGPRTEAAIKAALGSTGRLQAQPPHVTPPLPTPPADKTLGKTVCGWSQYRRGVEDLPPDQQAALKSIGDTIIASFRPGRRPVRTVDVCGHADWDTPRNPKREQQMSDERARAVTQWLINYAGDAISNRIVWLERGMGANRLQAPPTTEENRARNRRVEIYLDADRRDVCQVPPKHAPPNSNRGSLAVRVRGTSGEPLKTTVFLTPGGQPVQEAALATDANGYADFGQRRPGPYTITASGPGDYISTSVNVAVEAGKKRNVEIVLIRRQASWVDSVDWDEKFSRNYGDICSSVNMQRFACGLSPDYKLPLDSLVCATARKINPATPCCMSSNEIERAIDEEVCVRVRNEIVSEKRIDPGPTVRERYASWKQRARGGRPCV